MLKFKAQVWNLNMTFAAQFWYLMFGIWILTYKAKACLLKLEGWMIKGSVHHKYKRCLKHFIWSIYELQIFLNFFRASFHYDRVGPKLRIRSIDSKIRSMENKDKANGKETWDCTMAAFRCRGQMTFLMYAAICTHSSGNFEHNLYLRCRLPLRVIIEASLRGWQFFRFWC